MLDVMAGRDERDPDVGRSAVRLLPLRCPRRSSRCGIAFSPDLGFGVVEPGVAARVAEAADVLRGLGHGVEEVDLGLDDPWWIEETIWDSGMAALHADRFDEVRDLLDPGLVAVIESGLRRSGVEVARAYQARWPGSTGCGSPSRATTCWCARRCPASRSPRVTTTRAPSPAAR